MTTGDIPLRDDLTGFVIKPFDTNINRTAFSCGQDRIDNFFKYNIREHHSLNKIRAYCVVNAENIAVGYYYLVASSRNPNDMSPEAKEKFGRVNAAPCIYLGMLGVDKNYRKKNLGRILMMDAMQKTLEVANLIGIYALVLDALDDNLVIYYEKLGFKRFFSYAQSQKQPEEQTNIDRSMFLPLTTIRETLSQTR